MIPFYHVKCFASVAAWDFFLLPYLFKNTAISACRFKGKKQSPISPVLEIRLFSLFKRCMSFLYEDKKWSENLIHLEEKLCESLSKSWDMMKAIGYLEESSKGELYSLTDFWASFGVYKILKQVRG